VWERRWLRWWVTYGLSTFGGDHRKALAFAMAASRLRHSITGDMNLVTVAEVEKLMSGDVSGRVSRLLGHTEAYCVRRA